MPGPVWAFGSGNDVWAAGFWSESNPVWLMDDTPPDPGGGGGSIGSGGIGGGGIGSGGLSRDPEDAISV